MDSEDWERKGLFLFTQNRVDDALSAINTALSIDPTIKYYWFLKAEICNKLNHNSDAFYAFSTAISFEPNNPFSKFFSCILR
jgi:Tfp pilus assembly protein PilF